jgi:hypothetical protein
MAQPRPRSPQPIPLVPRGRFSESLLERFTEAAVAWARKHHPEWLTEPSEDELRDAGEQRA